MTHPEYRDGAYLFSPVGDNRSAPYWPVFIELAAPFVVALAVHFILR